MKISIILTVFHRVELLPRAVQSILWQTHQDWELLVFEDGEHLDARACIASLNKTRPDLLGQLGYAFLDGRQGQAGPWGHALRRKGLEIARGNAILWMSHYDVLHPDCLAAHAGNLAKGPCVSLVGVERWGKTLEYLGRRPEKSERIASDQFDLASFCLPVSVARGMQAFPEKYDGLKEAGWLTYAECLEAGLTVRTDYRGLAARF